MKTMKWTLLLAFFALWACQEEQFSQEGTPFDASQPFPRVERLRTIKRVDNSPASRAVGVKDKLWQPGDTIRIKFQNADEYPGMSDKVIQYAAIWLQYANLHFEYVSKEENADVKIGFNMDNRGLSWSTIGTDCKQIPQDEVSLNFVDLDLCSDKEIQGEVLRNFGHVLGLGFEHRSPTSPITLDEAKTLRNFRRDLSKEDIINDILPYYNTDQTNYTEFDPLSIMVLELPSTIQTDPENGMDLKYNYTLSPSDIAFVRDSLYPTPKRKDCLMEITIEGNYIYFTVILQDTITVEYDDGVKQTFYYDHEGPSYLFNEEKKHTIKIYGSNTAIKHFALQSNNITSLIVHENIALNELFGGSPLITSLDVSKCPALKDLNCSRSKVSYLDLSQNINLEFLNIDDCQFQSIDISKNLNLRWFSFANNHISNIDISKNYALEYLGCESNGITSLDLSKNPNLTSLFAYNNKLKTIDISNNPKMLNLTVPKNELTDIRFYNNRELIFLHCEHNKLDTLKNISSLTRMTVFYCHDNLFSKKALETIANDIRDCTGIETAASGAVSYSPLDDAISKIFKDKNWSIHTDNPYYSLKSLLNNSPKLRQLYSERSKNSLFFRKLSNDLWQ